MKTVLIVLALIIIGLVIYLVKLNNEAETYKKQSISLTDTLKVYKTKDGRNAAQISVVTGDKKDLEQILAKKDARLAEVLKQAKNVKYITTVETKTDIDTVVVVDTVRVNGSLSFQRELKAPYYNASVSFKKDSLSLNVVSIDTLDITHKMQSNGFLKGKTYIVNATLRNPKANIVGLGSYEIKEKPKATLPLIAVIALGVGAVLLFK